VVCLWKQNTAKYSDCYPGTVLQNGSDGEGVRWMVMAQDPSQWRTMVLAVLNLRILLPQSYSSRHQIACFKATEEFHPYRAAVSQQYGVASFATL
jgi:hypothetical protein